MRFLFVRHGESTANLCREFCNTGSGHPLTAKGVEQVRSTARDLSGELVEGIYSSPVERAVQTAQILADCLRAPLEISEALREWDVGIYEGTSDPAGWELHRQVQDDWFIHRKFDSRMPGGESYLDIQRRFVPFIDRLTQRGDGQSLVLVGHGGLFQAMLPAILSNVSTVFARQHAFPYAGYAVAESRANGLCCTRWCGVPLD